MSFYREPAIKATRKPHGCCGCLHCIEQGSAAVYLSCHDGSGDDPFFGHYHPDCRAAEVKFNKLHGVRPGDDWIPLTDAEDDDRAWLAADYPAVAARLFGSIAA